MECCTIQSLPEEVLVYIFSFLGWRDILNVSSTCKNLMNIMNQHPYLFKKAGVTFHSTNFKSGFNIFNSMSRHFCSYFFANFYLNREMFHFIEKFAPRFHRLYFVACRASDEDFEAFRGKIQHCNNLYEFCVVDCNFFVIFSHLPKLKSLYMQFTDIFPIWESPHIQKMAPVTLTHFSIQQTKIEFEFLEDFFRKRIRTLESVDLSWTRIKSEDMVKISKIEGLNLRRVQLSEFSDLIPFFHNQRAIVAISLDGVRNLDDTTMAVICNTLPQLEELAIQGLPKIDESVVTIFQLKSLQRLNLCGCDSISLESFLKALDGLACCNLKYLNLSYTNIEDTFMTRLLPMVANLRELVMRHCTGITDLTVFAISSWLKSLRHLDLSFCSKVLNDGLVGNILGPGSYSAPLSNNEDLLTSEQFTEDCFIEAIRFEWLEELNLTLCGKLSEAGKMAIREGNPRLVNFYHD